MTQEGQLCKGAVNFTCTGIRVSPLLLWTLDGTVITEYLYSEGDAYPFLLLPLVAGNSFPLGVRLEVLSVQTYSNDMVDIISILKVSDVSVLSGSLIGCGDAKGSQSNEINVILLAQGMISNTTGPYYLKRGLLLLLIMNTWPVYKKQIFKSCPKSFTTSLFTTTVTLSLLDC